MRCSRGGYCIDDLCYGGQRLCDGISSNLWFEEYESEDEDDEYPVWFPVSQKEET